ncbi:MAG TPA: HD domain-containing phosphohydrolase, partial [Longimicrobiales bacterium]|nr:HD domain-containing phosphohydrolase [Longimicrobiales bacterium]
MSKLGSIVFKEGKLTEYEYHEIKKHPTYSYRMLEKNALVSTKVKLAVLQHHERMDGSGYPLGIKAQQIHPYARIVMVCD